MELQEAVPGRRSIRQFLPKPVSEEMIKFILLLTQLVYDGKIVV